MLARSITALVLAALAAPAAAAPKSTTLLSTETTWNAAPIHYQCTGKPQVTAVKVEIPAGEATAWHTHPVGNYAYVVSGTLQLELKDGTTHVFKPGDAFAEVVDTVHRGKAVGKEPVVLVVWYTGEADRPFTQGAEPEAKPRP
jgi:quercetin dioxygenase-like cupin family protein